MSFSTSLKISGPLLPAETQRLHFRQIVPDDFESLLGMNSDPEVMKFVGNGSVRNRDQMLKELDMLISHYTRKPGLGIWALVLKQTCEFAGAAGLVYYDNTPQVEIGYRLPRHSWGKGYATEASRSLLKYGFEVLGLEKIVSSAHPDNIASRRVMEKIGMKLVDHRFQYGCTQAYYEIEKPGLL